MSDTPAPVYRALAMLENEYEPQLRRRSPYWRPRPPACWRETHLPTWNWVHPDYHEGLDMDLTVLDANGSFVSAASSATFAHGGLERTGALPEYRKAPGYYRINTHGWSDPRIVSPLGGGDLAEKEWVAHPTVELLVSLSEAGYWPGVQILDSWTCPDSVRFRKWATAVNNDRAEALHQVHADPDHDRTEGAGDCPCKGCVWYKAVKDGYAMAVQMMRGPAQDGPVKSAVKRPDWYDTIHAQYAASTWRYVWKCVLAGYVPVAMGAVDEVTWDTLDFQAIHEAGLMKIDNTGISLGHLKVKERIMPEAAAA
ncbi:hypothetical protein ACFW34_35075 [Streptomyces sp. NPDC058848]|uniref:hypothetical protein n=1 Tax=Streptomyces sp. NPDC058848 TaxID=3346650 RepID=UPI003699216B